MLEGEGTGVYGIRVSGGERDGMSVVELLESLSIPLNEAYF